MHQLLKSIKERTVKLENYVQSQHNSEHSKTHIFPQALDRGN